MSDSNFDGVLDPDSGWPDIPQASTQFVVLGGQGGPLNEQAKALAARTKKLKSDMENISAAGFGGQYKNLLVNVSGVGYQGKITADRLLVEDSNNRCTVLRSVSVTFDGSISGANGLDINSIVANTWYYIYVIYNGEAPAALLSLNKTTPSLPVGYTKFAFIGAVKSSASSFIQSSQVDNRVIYMASISSQSFMQVLNSGNATTVTAFSVASAVPPMAKKCTLNCNVSSSANVRSFLNIGSIIAFVYTTIDPGKSYTVDVDLLFGMDVYYKCDGNGGSMSNYVIGYTL